MHSSSLGAVLSSALIATSSAQTYVLTDNYTPSNFFSKFNFFTGKDPNDGFVNYQTQAGAQSMGLISTSSGSVRFGADSQNVISPTGPGRASVRLQSATVYNGGLFVADIAHMPGPACGIWPAYWTLGTGYWPLNGEIDILEGVNNNGNNQYSLHTGSTCSVSNQGQTGAMTATNCQSASGGVLTNTGGCNVQSSVKGNFGSSFNANGGGTYAMLWTDDYIRMWFFPRGQAPASLRSNTVDISKLGTPDANFQGCDVAANFRDHQIIFDTNFCGDWAATNAVYSDTCPLTIGFSQGAIKNCHQAVAVNPTSFVEGYWEVNSLKVYSVLGGSKKASEEKASVAHDQTPTSNNGTEVVQGFKGYQTTPAQKVVASSTSSTTVSSTTVSSVAGPAVQISTFHAAVVSALAATFIAFSLL